MNMSKNLLFISLNFPPQKKKYFMHFHGHIGSHYARSIGREEQNPENVPPFFSNLQDSSLLFKYE